MGSELGDFQKPITTQFDSFLQNPLDILRILKI